MSALRSTDLPQSVIERCPELHAKWQKIQSEAQMTFSGSEKSDNESAVESFLGEVRRISEKQAVVLKRVRQVSAEWTDIMSPKKQKLADKLAEIELDVLKRKMILATSKRTLQGEIVSRSPASLITDAFIDGLITRDGFHPTWPEDAPISYKDFRTMVGLEDVDRTSRRQGKFRRLLKLRYHNNLEVAEKIGEVIWDPVMGQWLHGVQVKAAHIAPLSMGEYEYARLIGEDWVTEDTISGTMWSEENGLLLHHVLEKYIDNNTIVIVPASDDSTHENREYKMVVLNDEYSNTVLSGTLDGSQVCLGDLDGRKLQWLNGNRPNVTNLYIRYLLSRILRRKSSAIGCEKDIEKVPPGPAWAEVGPLRRRTLAKVCKYIGDSVSEDGSPVRAVLDEGVNIREVPEREEEAEGQNALALGMATRLSAEHVDKVYERHEDCSDSDD